MTAKDIRQAIDKVTAQLASDPEHGPSEDSAAKAILTQGLRFRVEGPRGWVIETDMPATMIAARAAQEGVELERLEVTVTSQSDDRGMWGVGDPVPAGPLKSSARITISSREASSDKIREIVTWAEQHSPVGDALSRAVPHEVEIEIL